MSWNINAWPFYVHSAAAGGGTTTPVNLFLTITGTPVLTKRANLSRALSGSASPAIVKGVSTSHRVTTVGVAVDVLSVGKLLSLGVTAGLDLTTLLVTATQYLWRPLAFILGTAIPLPDGSVEERDRVGLAWSYIPAGSGGTTFNQALDLTITAAVSLLKQMGLPRSVGGSASPTMVKRAGLLRGVSGTGTAVSVKQVNNNERVTTVGVAVRTFSAGKTLVISATATPVLTFLRSFVRLLSLTITGSVSLTKRVGKIAALGTSASLALARSVGKTFIVSVSGALSSEQIKVLLVALSLTITASLSITVQFIAAVVGATRERLVGLMHGVGKIGRPW